jgi:ABC-type antimicrobial peptide transport system permease subunit
LGLPQTIMSIARAQSVALLAIAALALALGACSKCDVPAWGSPSPLPPQSCHDGPDTK